MIASNSKNFPIWKRVFEDVANKSKIEHVIDGEMEMIFEGSDMSLYPEVFVLGVFTISDKRYVAITFKIDASHDEFSDVKFEIQLKLEDLTLASLGEKIRIISGS